MKTQTQTVKSIDCIFSQVREQTVEADLLLPDYYPEIAKILNCAVRFTEESVTPAGEQLSVCGAAAVRLLFCDEAQTLSVYETTVKYTKVIPCGETAAGDVCFVRQTPASLNYRAVAPRKVEISAVAAIRAEVYRISSGEALSSMADDNIECRRVSRTVFCPDAMDTLRFELQGEVTLPCAKSQIRALLDADAAVRFEEVRAVKNKVMLRGSADVDYAFINTENAVVTARQTGVPFTEVRELYGVTEASQIFLGQGDAAVQLDLKGGGDGPTAKVSVGMRLLAVAGAQKELEAIDDAYALCGGIELKTAGFELPEDMREYRYTHAFTFEAEHYDADAREIAFAALRELRLSAGFADGALQVSGSGKCEALLGGETGAGGYFSRTATFSFSQPGFPEGGMAILGARSGDVRAAVLPEGRIRFSCEVIVEGCVCAKRRLSLVSDAAGADAPAEKSEPCAVLYYASPGETPWEIAKRSRAPLSALGTEAQDAALPLTGAQRFVFFTA